MKSNGPPISSSKHHSIPFSPHPSEYHWFPQLEAKNSVFPSRHLLDHPFNEHPPYATNSSSPVHIEAPSPNLAFKTRQSRIERAEKEKSLFQNAPTDPPRSPAKMHIPDMETLRYPLPFRPCTKAPFPRIQNLHPCTSHKVPHNYCVTKNFTARKLT